MKFIETQDVATINKLDKGIANGVVSEALKRVDLKVIDDVLKEMLRKSKVKADRVMGGG